MKRLLKRAIRTHAYLTLGTIMLFASLATIGVIGALPGQTANSAEPTKLAVVWTSGDPYVAHRVCLMYTHAAKSAQWFDTVNLIIWGPSAKLFTEDKEIQAKIKAMQKDGVIVQACIACANAYGVTEKIREHGIEVKGMGKPLTDKIQSDWKVLTF